MKKVIYNNTTINVVLQNTEAITSTCCPSGIISVDENGNLLFEEEIKRGKPENRNPILFDGPYLSLTRKKDGRYSFNMKPICYKPELDFKTFADGVRKDIKEAFKHINA